MAMNGRERFLLWVFAGLLSWQAALLTVAAVGCSKMSAQQIQLACSRLGDRYEMFVNASLGAVLGLLAGQAVNRRSDR